MEVVEYIVPNTTSLPSFAKLYDVPIGLIVLLAIAYGTVSLCAIVGNGIVLWVVVRSHRMRTVTNIFLANLAFADIIIGYAQGNLVLTALFSAAIVWVVGLAVPVTASYIMCAVIAAPALIKLGVPDFAAHMFIFYYAVLSEVSPPTALSPFAAAANGS